MKIKDYFSAQKQIVCPDELKNKIYNEIISNKDRNFLISRISFYHKVGIYFVFCFVLLLSFYIPYVVEPKDTTKISKIGSGYVLQQNLSQTTNQVNAENVGKILEAIGEVKVVKNGIESPSNILSHGDNILLLNGSELKFEVSSGTIAFIKGPAELKLEYIGEKDGLKNYVISLISGDYFEVLKNNPKDNSIVIKTQDFEVESQKIDDVMNMKILGEGTTKIIENKGGDVVVKKIVNNKKVFSSIKTNQKAQVDEEVKIIEEIKKIRNEFQTNQISGVFSLTGNIDEEEFINQDFSGNRTVTFNIPQTNSILETSKKVLDPNEMEELKNLTYPNFLMKDIENLYMSYLKGNKSSYNISYQNYLSRIKKLYKLFDLEIDSKIYENSIAYSIQNVNDLVLITDQLYAKLENGYYISDKYLKRIKATLGWLLILNDRSFGDYRLQTLEFDKILDILGKSNLSNELLIN